MAHARQKIALRVIRAVGFFFCFAQRLLHPRAFGGVVRDAEHFLVAFRPARGPEHVDDATIFADVAVHEIGAATSDQNMCGSFIRLLEIFRVEKLHVAVPDHLVRRVAKQFFTRCADAEESTVFVDHADDVLRVVHDQLVGVQRSFQLELLFAECLFRTPPLADVLDHHEVVPRISVFGADHAGSAFRPHDLAVLADQTLLAGVAVKAVDECVGTLPAVFDVFRNCHAFDGQRREFLFRIAKHFAEAGVHLQEMFVKRDKCHADRRLVENLAVVLLVGNETTGTLPNAVGGQPTRKAGADV